jgi:PAS domain S-box-containing protein
MKWQRKLPTSVRQKLIALLLAIGLVPVFAAGVFADFIVSREIQSASSVQQLRTGLFVAFVAWAVIVAIIAYIASRRITDPIRDMAYAAKQIGAGDLSVRTDIARNDEIGELGRSINNMNDSIGRFVQHLESERDRLSIINDNVSESILAIDKNGYIIQVNKAAAELAHLSPDKIVGRPVHSVFTWMRDQSEVKIHYIADKDRTYQNLEYTDTNKNIHYIKLVIAKVHSSGQTPIQAIVAIYDETKRRELDKMKLDFVSMAAHELRTPLTSVRGYLEIMRYKLHKNFNPDEIDHSIAQALRSSVELGGLINNLLDVSRIESGSLSFTPEKIDLIHDIISPAIKDISFSANDKRIALDLHKPNRACVVFADKIAMREVIDNLLSNALKYTDPDGNITVTIQKQDGAYEVSVADTGRGIPKQAIKHLFTKFYRVHGGLSSGSLGTGLGLYITKSIIERHNGMITVTSKEGVGSTFTFTIPGYSARKHSPQASNNKTMEHHGWTTKNITR